MHILHKLVSLGLVQSLSIHLFLCKYLSRCAVFPASGLTGGINMTTAILEEATPQFPPLLCPAVTAMALELARTFPASQRRWQTMRKAWGPCRMPPVGGGNCQALNSLIWTMGQNFGESLLLIWNGKGGRKQRSTGPLLPLCNLAIWVNE